MFPKNYWTLLNSIIIALGIIILFVVMTSFHQVLTQPLYRFLWLFILVMLISFPIVSYLKFGGFTYWGINIQPIESKSFLLLIISFILTTTLSVSDFFDLKTKPILVLTKTDSKKPVVIKQDSLTIFIDNNEVLVHNEQGAWAIPLQNQYIGDSVMVGLYYASNSSYYSDTIHLSIRPQHLFLHQRASIILNLDCDLILYFLVKELGTLDNQLQDFKNGLTPKNEVIITLEKIKNSLDRKVNNDPMFREHLMNTCQETGKILITRLEEISKALQ